MNEQLVKDLRFRKTPFSAETLTATVVAPIRAGAKGDHNFVSYWDARATLEEARTAVEQRPDGRHPVIGFATISIQILGVISAADADPELAAKIAVAEAEGDVELPAEDEEGVN